MADAKEKPITVAQLIEQLRALPQDAYVLTEGCDCVGPCSGVDNKEGYAKRGQVVLRRDDFRSDGADT